MNWEDSIKTISLYTTKMLPVDVKTKFSSIGKKFLPLKDMSDLPMHNCLTDAFYVVGNRFDNDAQKIIKYAESQDKLCRIFNTWEELR